MYLIVGLGNPGDKYARNRHNIGFMAVDAMRDDDPSIPDFKSKFSGLYTEGRFGREKAGLLKPHTYMNESGRSVGAACKFFKIPPERVIVIHDELDLKPGEVKVKKGGGNAGHNGLKSIQAHLGTPDFWRVRVGIGHPRDFGGGREDVSNYVLSDFAKLEREGWVADLLPQLFSTIQDNVFKIGQLTP